MKGKFLLPFFLIAFACGQGGPKPNVVIKDKQLETELLRFIDSLPKSPLYEGKFITVGIYVNSNNDTAIDIRNDQPNTCEYVKGFTNLKDFRIYFCSTDSITGYPFIEVKKMQKCPFTENKSQQQMGCDLDAEKFFYYDNGKLKLWTVLRVDLTQSDLTEVYGPYKEEGDQIFETNEPLDKFISVEFVHDFNEVMNIEHARDSVFDFVIHDSIYHKKKNGILELKAKNKIVKLIDNNESDITAEYTYLGHIPFLNQFLVFGKYYENQGYLFIDMTTGKQTIEFHDYPYISKDKKHIASIYMNPYGPNTEFDLYSIQDRKIKTTMRVSFMKWLPATEQSKVIFWINDNELVLRVAHVESFWREDGHLNNQFQTIKIRVK